VRSYAATPGASWFNGNPQEQPTTSGIPAAVPMRFIHEASLLRRLVDLKQTRVTGFEFHGIRTGNRRGADPRRSLRRLRMQMPQRLRRSSAQLTRSTPHATHNAGDIPTDPRRSAGASERLADGQTRMKMRAGFGARLASHAVDSVRKSRPLRAACATERCVNGRVALPLFDALVRASRFEGSELQNAFAFPAANRDGDSTRTSTSTSTPATSITGAGTSRGF
jgi:hypothetical protein